MSSTRSCAVGDQTDEIAVGRFTDVLRGHDEGAPLVAHGPELGPEALPQDGVDAARRFVEEQQLGIVDEGGGQGQSPLHPARGRPYSLRRSAVRSTQSSMARNRRRRRQGRPYIEAWKLRFCQTVRSGKRASSWGM